MKKLWSPDGYLVNHNETAAALQSVPRGNCYQQDLDMAAGPTPKQLAHWMYKEMQNYTQHTEYSFLVTASVKREREE